MIPIQSSFAHAQPCILFCLMRRNWYSLLAFPKLNKAVFILPSKAKTLLELFCHRSTWLVELVKWQGWYTWISGWHTRMMHLDWSQKYRRKIECLRLWGSPTSTVHATEIHANILFWYIYLLLHSKWLYKSQAQDNWKMGHFTWWSRQTGIDVDYEQMGCSKMLNIYCNFTAKILPSVYSEIKHSTQANTYT